MKIERPPLTTEEETILAEYQALQHAMQAGVGMDAGAKDQTPKHLRVGVNTAMSDHAGLVDLLVRKGVISSLEYFTAIRETMRQEADIQRKRASEQLGGANVTLV